ncbi:hypothetical protein H5410_060692, partial [Solanum commersonii]
MDFDIHAPNYIFVSLIMRKISTVTHFLTIYTHKIHNIFEKKFFKGSRAFSNETQVYCAGQ